MAWQEPHPGNRLLCASHFPAAIERRGSETNAQRCGGSSDCTVPTHTVAGPGAAATPHHVLSDTDSVLTPSETTTCQQQAEDSDMTIDTDESTLNSPSMLPLTPISPMSDYADVSNYLAVPYGSSQINVDQFVNPAVYTEIQSSPDMYGWDAILDRRDAAASASPDVSIRDSYLDAVPHPSTGRRGSAFKKNGGLLHRVFSIGKQSPRITPSRRPR